jgi:hypothetical protein
LHGIRLDGAEHERQLGEALLEGWLGRQLDGAQDRLGIGLREVAVGARERDQHRLVALQQGEVPREVFAVLRLPPNGERNLAVDVAHGADRDALVGITVGHGLRRLEAVGEPGIRLGGSLRDRDRRSRRRVFDTALAARRRETRRRGQRDRRAADRETLRRLRLRSGLVRRRRFRSRLLSADVRYDSQRRG